MKLNDLLTILETRKTESPNGSYTARLLAAGEDEILKKIGEESVEVILAAKGQGDERLVEEVADLFYHTLVLFVERDLSLEDVEQALEQRHSR